MRLTGGGCVAITLTLNLTPTLTLTLTVTVTLTLFLTLTLPGVHPFIVDVDAPPGADPFSKADGHVIAVRITAENAADGWKPTVGAISNIEFQSLPRVWGYFSVKTPNAEVHAFADSQFGHVFAHG